MSQQEGFSASYAQAGTRGTNGSFNGEAATANGGDALLSKAGLPYANPSADELLPRFAAVTISGNGTAAVPATSQASQAPTQSTQQPQQAVPQPMMFQQMPQEMFYMPMVNADGTPAAQAFYAGFDPSMMHGRGPYPMGFQQQGMAFNAGMYGAQPYYGRPMQGQFPPMIQPMLPQAQTPSQRFPGTTVQPISRQFQAGPGETLIANKLFVGGLSYDLSELELVQAFARYGAQKANIICDRETGRSRGYGFVTFDSELSASEAMTYMQGVDVHGRRIRIGPATARAQTRAFQQHQQQLAQQQMAAQMAQQQQQQFQQFQPPVSVPTSLASSSFPLAPPKGTVDVRAPAPSTPSKFTGNPPAALLAGGALPKDWSSADSGFPANSTVIGDYSYGGLGESLGTW